MTIASGWHVNSHRPSEDYLIATAVKLDAQAGVTFGEPMYPAGVEKKFAFSESALSVYESAFAIEVPVMWDASRRPRRSRASSSTRRATTRAASRRRRSRSGRRTRRRGERRSQRRSARHRGSRRRSAVPLAEAAAAAGSTAAAGASRDFGDMLDRHGMLLVLLSIFLGGLALNLTPCVYPVIPLTIGFFGGQAAGSRGRRFGLAGLYVLGMATMYSALGVAAALSGKLFGSMLQNPWVLAAIAAALVALALSMFGV